MIHGRQRLEWLWVLALIWKKIKQLGICSKHQNTWEDIGYIKYYLIRIVFLEIYWPNYYFTIVIMEATRIFCWFLAIYLPAIGAHNHIVLILQALFLSVVSYSDWPFLHLLLTEGTHYLIQFIFNYFIAINYIMILHRYFMFKYY